MDYNFDEVIDRHGTASLKWDSATAPDVLPMWVADMDFKTAPSVIAALRRRVEHGIFGYVRVPDAYYEAVTGWFARRHGWTIDRQWMIYTSGVVPAVSAVIKALTRPGDKVVLQTPDYNCFFSSIRNNECTLVSNPLKRVGNTYVMDYDDLDTKLADPAVKLLVLCNPHNPVGRVWHRDELVRLGEMCIRHGVTVVADEIHCELVYEGHRYTPFASISDDFLRHSVTCFSPSKAFNIAGLQIATIVAADAEVRGRIDRAINVNEVCDVNPFGVEATIAAYNEGGEWLDALLAYLKGNYDYMADYCACHLADFPITELEGTYLVWMDCRALCGDSVALEQQLIDGTRLWLNAGAMYGVEGEGFMRWNLACPRSVLNEGLDRFASFVRQHGH